VNAVGNVLFHGTNSERDELLRALARNCECAHDPSGAVTVSCPGHRSLMDSQSYVDHLEFARTLRDQLRQGEWSTRPTHRPGGKP
jgi:hypothetical protein